jgi:hypothetical protein
MGAARAGVVLAFATMLVTSTAAQAGGQASGLERQSLESRAGRATPPVRPRARASAAGGKVAVQPIAGPNGETIAGLQNLRSLIVRIVRGRGFRTMTSLPHYEGTGQYPLLARDHHLSAFVTADLEDRGRWQRITFLVWNGLTGSVLGRWTASAPTPVLASAVGKGFWQHLGPAIQKAEAPPRPPGLERAPPMRIDASDPNDGKVATRE